MKMIPREKFCASYIIIKCFQCTYIMGRYTSTVDNVNKKQGMKGFQAVENVYEGEQVFKYESICHYQKWEIICENYLHVYKENRFKCAEERWQGD